MPRQPAPLVAQRNAALGQRSRALTAAPPFWGYRRRWAYLPVVEPQPVNKKRLLRLMRAPHRLGPPTRRRQAKRTPSGRNPTPTPPNQGWGLEMTKVLGQEFGWIYMAVVRDWSPEVIVGS